MLVIYLTFYRSLKTVLHVIVIIIIILFKLLWFFLPCTLYSSIYYVIMIFVCCWAFHKWCQYLFIFFSVNFIHMQCCVYSLLYEIQMFYIKNIFMHHAWNFITIIDVWTFSPKLSTPRRIWRHMKVVYFWNERWNAIALGTVMCLKLLIKYIVIAISKQYSLRISVYT